MLRVPAHHHGGNGIVERYNRNLIARIRYLLFENHGSWTDHVQRAAEQIRGMVHKKIRKTPTEIMQGTPLEWEHAANQHVQSKMKSNRRLKVNTYNFKEGE